jgi:hypothetical protein
MKLAKKNGAEKLYTHSPESKAQHTGAGTTHSVYNDSYKKVPRSMGFKPVNTEEMPLTENGRQSFKIADAEDPQDRARKHTQASMWHSHVANALSSRMVPETDPLFQHHAKMAETHWNKASELSEDGVPFSNPIQISNHHGGAYPAHDKAAIQGMETGKPVNFEEDQKLLNEPLSGAKYLQGHVLDLKPDVLKKNIELADILIKAEILLINKLAKKEDVEENIHKVKLLRGYFGYE